MLITLGRLIGSVRRGRSVVVHVKVIVVSLSFCWRGRRHRIQPIQLCTEAEIVCPDEVLALSVCGGAAVFSINILKEETVDPQIHKRLLFHWHRLREHSESRYSQLQEHWLGSPSADHRVSIVSAKYQLSSYVSSVLEAWAVGPKMRMDDRHALGTTGFVSVLKYSIFHHCQSLASALSISFSSSGFVFSRT